VCLFRQLNLSNNCLCDVWDDDSGRLYGDYTSEGINAIADAFRVNGALTALNLSSNSLEDEGVSAVCKAIQSNKETKLASLNFENNGIGPVGASAVAAMVAVTGALTVTNLLRNQLDEASAKMLAEVAKQKGISLCGIRRDQTTANFSNQNLELPDVILLASDLSQADVTGGLTKMSLAKNKLGEEGIKAICEALKQNKTLKEFDLSGYNNIGGEAGAKHVADMLGVNGGLTSINLSGNALCGLDWQGKGIYTAEGITAIADALRVNGSLTKLSLAQNKLEEEGTKAICEALEQNTTLKELDISGDRTCGDYIGGSAGAKHVAKMLGVNGGLTALDLSFNELNDDGVSAVCEAIQSNKETKLASLNMGANGIGPVGAKSVAALVAITGALTRVDVRYNNIAGDGAAQLAAAVLGNLKIEMFNEIPIKEMRANSITELDLNGKDVGVEGGMVVAGLIPVMGALTALNLSSNQIGGHCGTSASKSRSPPLKGQKPLQMRF
jgi:Ran GTPase-activating protein (RanGAP) involved in mRNA processing and transport